MRLRATLCQSISAKISTASWLFIVAKSKRSATRVGYWKQSGDLWADRSISHPCCASSYCGFWRIRYANCSDSSHWIATIFWLQGIVSLGALLTTTVVLITQNREAQLEEQRLELELQVNLLTEQKTTKLIRLLEELRRDLPMVKDRHDPEAAALQKPTNPEEVLAALEERRDKD